MLEGMSEKELAKLHLSVLKGFAEDPFKDALTYMVDVMDDYDGYDVNDAKLLKKLIDKMVNFAKKRLREGEE